MFTRLPRRLEEQATRFPRRHRAGNRLALIMQRRALVFAPCYELQQAQVTRVPISQTRRAQQPLSPTLGRLRESLYPSNAPILCRKMDFRQSLFSEIRPSVSIYSRKLLVA